MGAAVQLHGPGVFFRCFYWKAYIFKKNGLLVTSNHLPSEVTDPVRSTWFRKPDADVSFLISSSVDSSDWGYSHWRTNQISYLLRVHPKPMVWGKAWIYVYDVYVYLYIHQHTSTLSNRSNQSYRSFPTSPPFANSLIEAFLFGNTSTDFDFWPKGDLQICSKIMESFLQFFWKKGSPPNPNFIFWPSKPSELRNNEALLSTLKTGPCKAPVPHSSFPPSAPSCIRSRDMLRWCFKHQTRHECGGVKMVCFLFECAYIICMCNCI